MIWQEQSWVLRLEPWGVRPVMCQGHVWWVWLRGRRTRSRNPEVVPCWFPHSAYLGKVHFSLSYCQNKKQKILTKSSQFLENLLNAANTVPIFLSSLEAAAASLKLGASSVVFFCIRVSVSPRHHPSLHLSAEHLYLEDETWRYRGYSDVSRLHGGQC